MYIPIEHTAEIFKAILAHMREGGSYRYLIYERLGYGPEAYSPLYCAGGMDISNYCPVEQDEEWRPFISSLQLCEVADPGKPSVFWNEKLEMLGVRERQVENPDDVSLKKGGMAMVGYVCRPGSGGLEIIGDSWR